MGIDGKVFLIDNDRKIDKERKKLIMKWIDKWG